MMGCLPPGSIRSETGQQPLMTSGGSGEYQHLTDQPLRCPDRWHTLSFLFLKAGQDASYKGNSCLFPRQTMQTDAAENLTGNLNHKAKCTIKEHEVFKKISLHELDNELKQRKNLYMMKQG